MTGIIFLFIKYIYIGILPKLFWTAVIINKIPNSITAFQIILALYIVNKLYIN
jgi:hypothetical protein